MKDVFKYLEVNDKKYPFVFNINVYQEILNKFGKKNGLQKFMNDLEPIEKGIDANGNEIDVKGEPNMETFIWFFKECINEGIDMENDTECSHYIKRDVPRPFLTSEKQVGRIISALPSAQEDLMALFSDSLDSGIEKNE